MDPLIRDFLQSLLHGDFGGLKVGVNRSTVIYLFGSPAGEIDDLMAYGDLDVWIKNAVVERFTLKFVPYPRIDDETYYESLLLNAIGRLGVDWYPKIGGLLTQSQLSRLLKRTGVGLAEWTTHLDPQETLIEIEQSQVFVCFYKRRIYNIRCGNSFSGAVFTRKPL